MVVNIRKKRELIARMLDVGVNRVRFEPDKLDDVADSITRENIRALIKNRTVWTVKPKGKDNKMRKQVSGVPSLVKIGYRGPRAARGLHPSGYTDNLVFNVNDVVKLDAKKDAARLAHTVGRRKRKEIIEKANSIGIKILNAGKLSPKKNDREKEQEEENS